ncbi:MAG: Rpn family recombination-promoting nuclease/putative transposase [Pirellulales bacterium]
MPLRVDPRVDFASKKMLGSPEHPAVTIHFLNSILKPQVPLVDVTILNPLIGKDRSEDKIVILDILAKDSIGRLFNIEVQTRLPLCFPNRLLYYNSRNYWQQLHHGEGYSQLRPAISISLVDRRMFTEPARTSRWYHSFRLRSDQDSSLVLTDDFEFHIFELPKFHPSSDNIGQLPPDQKWLYLFTRAATMESEQLSDLLGDAPYREAIGVLEMISKTPEDYQYYEDRLKFLRDEEAKLADAKQEGLEQGLEKGREEGTRRR